MGGPEPVGWLLAALCGGVGGYCLLRLRATRGPERQAVGVEGVMAVGMASMALPGGEALLPPTAWAVVWTALFAAAAGWSLVLLRGGVAHQAHHVVEAGAMVSMALAMASAPAGHHGAHAGGPGGGAPMLTGALVLYFALYALLTARRLVPAEPSAAGAAAAPAPGGAGHPPGARRAAAAARRPPEVAAGCRLAMALAMCAMLLAG